MSLLDIPEYRAAVNAETVARELAFMPGPLPICGVPIRHMNARHHILLAWCGNAFVTGARPQSEDVAFFLWALSPDYTTEPGFREAFIAEKVRGLDFVQAVVAIYRYLDGVWLDWPAGDRGERKHYTAPVASLVDLLATEYGWRDEDILEMPLHRIFQYLRRIAQRRNPKTPQFNASDRVLSAHLMGRSGAN
jgi:hypothetical protein